MIEFFKGNEPYFSELAELLETNQVYATEHVFGELMQGARGKREIELINQYWLNLKKPSSEFTFYKAGLESNRNHWYSQGIGLLDASLVLLSLETDSPIWSLDKRLNTHLKDIRKNYPQNN